MSGGTSARLPGASPIFFFSRGEGGLMHFDASLHIGENFLHREGGSITSLARVLLSPEHVSLASGAR